MLEALHIPVKGRFVHGDQCFKIIVAKRSRRVNEMFDQLFAYGCEAQAAGAKLLKNLFSIVHVQIFKCKCNQVAIKS